MEHFRRPRNEGRLNAPDAVREGANPLCGDRVRIELALRDGRVAEARFTANACAISVAAASLLTERVRGMPISAVQTIREDELLAELGAEVPPARRACAVLPLTTMCAALVSFDHSASAGPSSPSA
jgi:nitrogen fixation NifU-like protein